MSAYKDASCDFETYFSAHCEDLRSCPYSISHSCFPGAFSHAMHKTMYNSRSGYCLTLLAGNTMLLKEISHIYELSKNA